MQKAQLAEEQRQFNVTQASKTTSSSGTGSSSKSSGTNSGSINKSSSGTNSASVSKGNSSNSSTNKKTLQSVLDLGYGPISASNLASKVASGEVKEVNKDDVTTFVKNTKSEQNTNKYTKLANRYSYKKIK